MIRKETKAIIPILQAYVDGIPHQAIPYLQTLCQRRGVLEGNVEASAVWVGERQRRWALCDYNTYR